MRLNPVGRQDCSLVVFAITGQRVGTIDDLEGSSCEQPVLLDVPLYTLEVPLAETSSGSRVTRRNGYESTRVVPLTIEVALGDVVRLDAINRVTLTSAPDNTYDRECDQGNR